MQIVSLGDNLHEMLKPVFCSIVSLSVVEFAQSVVSINETEGHTGVL